MYVIGPTTRSCQKSIIGIEDAEQILATPKKCTRDYIRHREVLIQTSHVHGKFSHRASFDVDTKSTNNSIRKTSSTSTNEESDNSNTENQRKPKDAWAKTNDVPKLNSRKLQNTQKRYGKQVGVGRRMSFEDIKRELASQPMLASTMPIFKLPLIRSATQASSNDSQDDEKKANSEQFTESKMNDLQIEEVVSDNDSLSETTRQRYSPHTPSPPRRAVTAGMYSRRKSRGGPRQRKSTVNERAAQCYSRPSTVSSGKRDKSARHETYAYISDETKALIKNLRREFKSSLRTLENSNSILRKDLGRLNEFQDMQVN